MAYGTQLSLHSVQCFCDKIRNPTQYVIYSRFRPVVPEKPNGFSWPPIFYIPRRNSVLCDVSCGHPQGLLCEVYSGVSRAPAKAQASSPREPAGAWSDSRCTTFFCELDPQYQEVRTSPNNKHLTWADVKLIRRVKPPMA